MLQQIILYAVLLVAAIGAMVGWSNSKKGAAWGQPMTIICAIIAICMGLYLAYRNSSNTVDREAAIERENTYRLAKVSILAGKVNELLAGKKAIVVVDPSANPEKDIELVKWKEILNLTNDDFAKPDEPPRPAGEDPETYMSEPLEEWFREAMLKKILEGKQFDYVIFTTVLPRDIKAKAGQFLAPFLKGKTVVFANGDLMGCAPFFHTGVAVAAITSNPKAVYDDKPAPKEVQAAFDKRYILVTKENFEELVKSNPDLFGIQK